MQVLRQQGPARKDLIRGRVQTLIAEFEKYLDVFREHPAFQATGQFELHDETIKRRLELGGAAAALADDSFLRSLWLTLGAWGIGKRGSRFENLEGFKSAMRAKQAEIVALEPHKIDDRTLDIQSISDRIWDLIESLGIVDNKTKIVPGTKALHHVLPDLVVPMDRRYTQTFFGWHNPEFQNQQKRCFTEAFAYFVEIARSVSPGRFVDRGTWNSSPTKVIDNAVVGFCQANNLEPSG